jgi:hypothetical protein
VRDAALTASGLLVTVVGGPSVYPPQAESVAKESFYDKWSKSTGSDRFRRGLYTYMFRLAPFAQGVTFDAPPLSRGCTRRERSNTPLQALTLLNDPVFFEAARALAGRLMSEAPSLEGRLHHGFMLCLGRPPSPRERERLLAYIQEQRSLLAGEPTAVSRLWSQVWPGVDPTDAATLVAFSSVLLNLHEFITRD